MGWRQRLATWLDPTPERLSRDLYDLVLKSARRCAHDLDHCASDIGVSSPYMTAAQWHDHARVWLRVFYPDGGPKDYMARICREYETALNKLTALCRKNGVDPNDGDLPF